jgi:AcrR family transcriptional regulator
MDAAIAQLRTRGVLAGLNLREVADAVGVTPANIYHYFGSRQGLLRAAINRAADQLGGPLDDAAGTGFTEHRLRMFDAIVDNADLQLTALLAIDGDPDYRPLPFIDVSVERYRRMAADGEIPEDLDAEALHILGLATAIGLSIYAEVAARQLDSTADDLVERTRAVYERMLRAVTS